jgi:hypothetical protein
LPKAELAGADLSGLELGSILLGRADLTAANLHRINLTWADLEAAELRDANLTDASLFGADLTAVDLSRAQLVEADLRFAIISGAELRGANITGAILGETILADVDLSGVEGLEAVVHERPSTIGIDTIIRSNGQIPEVFLRGCGVPEPFIVNMKALLSAMDPIQFYSCFISYSTKDQDFADRLHADLQARGVRCWFAPHDVQAGKKMYEQVDEAIRVYDKLLLVLSPDSIRSNWVKMEIAKARKKEMRDERRVLFPIRLCTFEALREWKFFDPVAGKDLAWEIKEYYIPDFSSWKDHDSYAQAFQQLLRDLRAEQAAGA